MLSNVACSSPGCTNPVVGQCGGYKKNCGSFYCAVHSKDKLCSECSERKGQDDLIEEYYKLAQYADQHPRQEQRKRTTPLGYLVLAMGLPLACMFFYLIPNGIQVSNFMKWVILLSVPLGIVGYIALGIYAVVFETSLRKKIVADLVATKPNFREFYDIYKSEKRKDMLRMAGGIAMGVIASVAADAQRSYERQRKEEMIRKAVDDELNRHGL